MNFLMTVFLMAPPAADGQSSPWTTFIFLGLIIVIFYFFMIRPQMKRQKELTNYRKSLKKGDKVITTGGIYGKISDIKDQYVFVEISDNVIIKIDFNAILKDPADLNQQK
jgi:preprotein translocase subunit YajC